MLITPICVRPVLPNCLDGGQHTGDRNWGIFLSGLTMSLGSAIVLILQLHQLQGLAGFCNVLSFEELTLKQRQWPQGSWVVLSSNRARELAEQARSDTARPQGHWDFLAVWHLPLSQFSHHLNLKFLSVFWRLTCRSWNFFFCSSPRWAVSIQSLVFCLLLLVSVTGQSRQVAGPSLLCVLGYC